MKTTGRTNLRVQSKFLHTTATLTEQRVWKTRAALFTGVIRGVGLFGANPLTGSIGVVTINMPRLGYLAASEDDFLGRLGRLMEVARTSLETKRKVLEGFTEKNLYPYTKFYLRDVKQRYCP